MLLVHIAATIAVATLALHAVINDQAQSTAWHVAHLHQFGTSHGWEERHRRAAAQDRRLWQYRAALVIALVAIWWR